MTEATPPPAAPRPWWLLVAAAALSFVATSGPDLYDSGELVQAAWRLGGSHPPGQPLHAMLAHVLCLLPLGPIPWRIALFSVLSACAAAFVTHRLLWELLTDTWEGSRAKRGGEGLGQTHPSRTASSGRTNVIVDRTLVRWVRRLAPDAAALAVLLGPALFRQTLRVEVYGLALLIFASSVLYLFRWARGGPGAGAALRHAALLAGLSAAVHPPHALGCLLVGGCVLGVARRDVLRRFRPLGWAAVMCTLGLGLYLWLPLRAHAGAPMWGSPEQAAGLWSYVTATAYRANLGNTGTTSWLTQAGQSVLLLSLWAGVVPWLGALLLLRDARHRSPTLSRARLALLLAIPVSGLATLVTPLSVGNPDTYAYAGPTILLLVVAGCLGAVALVRRGGAAAPLGALLLLAIGVHPTAAKEAITTARQANTPALSTLADALWATPPARSLVVVETDYVASTWLAGRDVYGMRPDVALLIEGLATSSWHWRTLDHHPLFDGVPVRGAGEDGWSAYVDGAVQTALGRVPITTESARPVGGNGALAGPYLVVAAQGVPTSEPVWRDAAGERLVPAVARQAPGEGPASAVFRHVHMARAERLAIRGHGARAADTIEHALGEQPWAGAPGGPLSRPISPVVRQPDAFLTSPADATRHAAVLMWAMGEDAIALRLLERQTDRGDPRAVLQLAWMHASTGNHAAATEALAAFRTNAPQLSDEARALESILAP